MKVNKTISKIAVMLFLLGLFVCANGQTNSNLISIENIVDLTHTLTPDFPYNKVAADGDYYPFRTLPLTTIKKDGSAANAWIIHEHIGTQIDAPSHFTENGKTLDQMPVQDFLAPLAVIDISERAKRNADVEVTVDDIKNWEKQHGRLPKGAAVFMYSGWDAKVNDEKAFLNMDESKTLHFPAFALETVQFLIRERQVVGIGVDTLSIDIGKAKGPVLPVHKAWHDAGKWNVECVANLSRVPPAGATVFVGASKVIGAAGGLVRLIATFPSKPGR